MEAQGIENSPDLALVLEPFLLNLLGRIGIDRLPVEAVDLESHGEHFSHSRSCLDVARAATVHPVLERLLNGGGAHCQAAGLAVDHVGSDVLEGDEEAQDVALCDWQRRQQPIHFHTSNVAVGSALNLTCSIDRYNLGCLVTVYEQCHIQYHPNSPPFDLFSGVDDFSSIFLDGMTRVFRSFVTSPFRLLLFLRFIDKWATTSLL